MLGSLKIRVSSVDMKESWQLKIQTVVFNPLCYPVGSQAVYLLLFQALPSVNTTHLAEVWQEGLQPTKCVSEYDTAV